jgi:hypothetical protein
VVITLSSGTKVYLIEIATNRGCHQRQIVFSRHLGAEFLAEGSEIVLHLFAQVGEVNLCDHLLANFIKTGLRVSTVVAIKLRSWLSSGLMDAE